MFKVFANFFTRSFIVVVDANGNIFGVNLGLLDLVHRNSPVNFAYIFTIFNGTVNGIISNLIFNPINSKGTQISSLQDNRIFTFRYGNMLITFANFFTRSFIVVVDANGNIFGVNLRLFDLVHSNGPVNFAYILTIFNGTIFGCISNLIFNPINSKGAQIGSLQDNRIFTFRYGNMLEVFANFLTRSFIVVVDANGNIFGVNLRLFDFVHSNGPANFAYILAIFNGTIFGCISNLIFNPINSKVFQISRVKNDRVFTFRYGNMFITFANFFTRSFIVVVDANRNLSAITVLIAFVRVFFNNRRNFLCRHGNRSIAT